MVMFIIMGSVGSSSLSKLKMERGEHIKSTSSSEKDN